MDSWLFRQGLNYAVGRLQEPSTWAAIAAGMATSWNMQFNNDFTHALVSAGMALAVLLGVVLKEGVRK